MSSTIRLTTAQALVRFLHAQHVERDGQRQGFFGGCFGIFGHGNLAGVGEALQEHPELRYIPARNEQAMVSAAVAFAKMHNRLQTFACTSSVGPGATNMVTGAAIATINRLPVLLLPGDVFATRRVDPVLQQLETTYAGDLSVNDCFRPVSRYFDRIWRPEMLAPGLLQAMRVLTDPAETGAVTLALPQDVQAEAHEFEAEFLEERDWRVGRPLPEAELIARAARMIGAARRPLIVAGGGVLYSDATGALRAFVEQTGISVGETQAGKGSLPYDHPSALGGIGSTGTRGANLIAREADLVIGIGTRFADFTTASRTAFANPDVRFVNVNVAAFDAFKLQGLPLVGDARATLEALAAALAGHRVADAYARECAAHNRQWDEEVARIYARGHGPLPSQGEVIGAVNDASGPRSVVICAAGSMPGDLHKLWRTRDPKGYHVEYGFSTMGYEVAAGLGVKLADPSREVFVLVGDASWLMLSSELVTAVQEDVKIIVVLVDNHGYASIGALSGSLGSAGFGTRFRRRDGRGEIAGDVLPIDFVKNAESLGVRAVMAPTITSLREALEAAQAASDSTVIVVETDPAARVDGYESWWDVPVAEVSTLEDVQAARLGYERERARERAHLGQP